jgi:hypothetical protein
MSDDIIPNRELFDLFMRRLSGISREVPAKEGEKILYIISQLEDLHYYPHDIRVRGDYKMEFDYEQ